MDIEILVLLIAVVLHIVIFNRSSSINRKKRLSISLSLIGASIVLFVVGLMLGLGGNYDFKNLAVLLIYSPVYLSLLSFVVYLPRPGKDS